MSAQLTIVSLVTINDSIRLFNSSRITIPALKICIFIGTKGSFMSHVVEQLQQKRNVNTTDCHGHVIQSTTSYRTVSILHKALLSLKRLIRHMIVFVLENLLNSSRSSFRSKTIGVFDLSINDIESLILKHQCNERCP